jgi:hypothetical protein
MGGGSTISTTEQKLGNVRLQTSAYGLTLVKGYGRNRLPGNLFWYDGFHAVAHTTTTTSGGKGGGGVTQKDTTYTYFADAMMGIGQGPMMSIQSAWKMKDRYLGSSLAGSQSCAENLVIPANKLVKLSFFAFYTSMVSVVLISNNNSANVTLTNPADYTVSAGVITIVNSAYIGRVIRVNYTWTPAGDMTTCESELGMTLFQGNHAQGTWSYLSSAYPAAALPYSNVSYLAAANYQLDNSASFVNHNFEVNFKLQYSTSIPDANAADIAVDLLTNPDSGARFPGAQLGDLTTWSDYIRAFSLFLSPTYIEQREARDIINELAEMTNSATVWSGGQLKVIPYGDTAATGNGVTYTPNTTPVYDLTDDHFQVTGDEDPVRIERRTPADSFNRVQIEFTDRTNGYNTDIAPADDLASIETIGLRPRDPIKTNGVCSRTVARTMAQLKLQRDLYIKNTYEFLLPWNFCLLEPMDLVTLTDTKLNLNRYPVRIISIDEDDSGFLMFRCEDFPIGATHATLYPNPVVGGYQPATNADPGSVTPPILFEGPIDQIVIDNEIWAAVSGAGVNWGGCTIWYSVDGVTYKRFGSHYGSRYGSLTANMVAGVGATASVLLTGKGGQMFSGTTAEASAGATLCWCNGEFFNYETAALTGTNAYNLTTLVRGLSGTSDLPHVSTSPFVRVDQGVAKIGPLDLKLVGQTFYFKFTSFNVYGNAEQSLADVVAYPFTITRDVASDNLLTPPEKPTVKLDYDTVIAEQAGIDAQATALTITTEKTDYDNKLAALVAYMATLTTPVLWSNINGNTILP